MKSEPDIQPERDGRTHEEIARLAEQLAEHGFHVVGALLASETPKPAAEATKRPN